MQTYKLHTLLLFFKAQQKIKYEAIEIIIGILEDIVLDNEDKKDSILFILHKYGLNEFTLQDGNYEPKIASCKLPDEAMRELDHTNYQSCLMTEAIKLKILNGDFMCEVGLN